MIVIRPLQRIEPYSEWLDKATPVRTLGDERSQRPHICGSDLVIPGSEIARQSEEEEEQNKLSNYS